MTTPENSPEIRVRIGRVKNVTNANLIALKMIGSDGPLDVIGMYGGLVFDEKPHLLEPGSLQVKPEARGNGYGELLMRRLVQEARELGVEVFRGSVESQYALDIRARVFGTTSMRFFDEVPDPTYRRALHYVELPMTFEQARESLVRAGTHEEDLEFRDHGITIEQPIVDK